MALWVAGLSVELREVELRAKPEALRLASPKATVPVLQLADRVLEESLEIMVWALEQHDPAHWLYPAGSRELTLRLIAANDGPFKQALDRYKYPARAPQTAPLLTSPNASSAPSASSALSASSAPSTPSAPSAAHEARAVGAAHLQDLNERLAPHGYLVAAHPSLADFALVPFVRQYAGVDPAWFQAQPLKHLQVWLQRLTTTTPYTCVMGKYPPWAPGQTPIVYGPAHGN